MNKCTLLSGIISFLILVNSGYSQTTLYTHNFGPTTVTTFPTGWSSTGGSTGWGIYSANMLSSGYTGASGGNHVRITGSATSPDTLYFSNISTIGYTNISVLWGARNSSISSTLFEWSTDSITWNTVSFTDVAGNSTWALVNGGTGIALPSGAGGASNLMFRWSINIAVGMTSYRIDDFTVRGTVASTLPPSKISISSVNGGINPDSCNSFNIIVETLDINGIPVNVTSPSSITLTKHTGTGSGVLSGGSGTIPSGQGSCTITVTYSKTETGVSLLASCGTLTTDTSNIFDVLLCIYCPASITYSGQTYNTIAIGTQCWMKENLNVGTMINYINVGDQVNNSTIEKYCYSNVPSNCVTYGGLYQWAEMVQYFGGATNSTSFTPPLTNNLQGICPPNWHIPTTAEWTTLQNYLGPTAGNDMRETGFNYWNYNSSYTATNSSGFSARGSGSCNTTGSYARKSEANFWCVDDLIVQPLYADYIMLANNIPNMYVLSGMSGATKTYALSVRCILDNSATGISHNLINSDELVNIYPNPAKNYINLNFQNLIINDAEIKIYDMPGNIVYSEVYNSLGSKNIKTINIGNLQTGNYILQVNWGKIKYSKKIVIIK